MFILKKFQLQEFAKHSGGIQGQPLPILSYLKLDKNGILSKTNQAISLSYQIDISGEAEDILLDERTLFSLVNKTNSDVITIKNEGKSIIISDGTNHLNHAVEDFKMFPNLPELPTTNPTRVTSPIINTIKIARGFIATEESAANFRAVHIQGNYIAAFNNHLFYIKEFKFTFPNVILLDEYCDILTQYNSADFWETERHYFYKFNSKLLFVFTKTEFKTPAIDERIAFLKAVNNDKFSIKKSELVDFCELANGLTNSKQIVCSFAKDPVHGSIIFLQDNDYAKGVKSEIKVDGEIQEFNFNSKITISAFKSIPDDQLSCTVVNKGLVINQNNYWACFMGTQV